MASTKWRKVTVHRVWTGWADEIANRYVYGTLFKPRNRTKSSNRAASRFLGARRAWNRYVNKAHRAGHIDITKVKQMCGCRTRGAKLNIDETKYSCHHGLCVYEYYAWLTDFMRKQHEWLRGSEMDRIIWCGDIDDNDIFDPLRVQKALDRYRSLRSYLVERARTEDCMGAATCCIWPREDPDHAGMWLYQLRIVIAGRGLRQDLANAVQDHPDIQPSTGVLSASYGVTTSQVVRSLQYCRAWLRHPYDLSGPLIRWQQRLKSVSFAGPVKRYRHM